jgi:hypothetical protein
MSTDRELLELAAKAMHASGEPNFRNYTVYADRVCLELGSRRGAITGYWKPLTDDGDAFRLAVRLKLFGGYHGMESSQFEDGDPYAATRRAIVRAAAEIGKGQQ